MSEWSKPKRHKSENRNGYGCVKRTNDQSVKGSSNRLCNQGPRKSDHHLNDHSNDIPSHSSINQSTSLKIKKEELNEFLVNREGREESIDPSLHQSGGNHPKRQKNNNQNENDDDSNYKSDCNIEQPKSVSHSGNISSIPIIKREESIERIIERNESNNTFVKKEESDNQHMQEDERNQSQYIEDENVNGGNTWDVSYSHSKNSNSSWDASCLKEKLRSTETKYNIQKNELEKEKEKYDSLEEEHSKQSNELDLLKRMNKNYFEKLENLEEERKVDSYQKEMLQQEINALKGKLEEQMKQNNALEEKHKQLASDHSRQVEIIKKLEEERNEVNARLIKQIPELNSNSLGRYKKSFYAFFNSTRNSLMSTKEQDRLVIKLQQKFNMQDFFDVHYDTCNGKRSASLLFHTLDEKKTQEQKNYHAYKIVNEWNVNIYSTTWGMHSESACAREFISQCWKQMGRLRILRKEQRGKRRMVVKLFETWDNGVVPVQDDTLNYQLARAFPDENERSNARKRANSYYRAIGRIMLHALSNGYTISASAMPPFYQNWLLRGCSPKDDDYHNDDVLQHLSDGGASKTVLYSMLGQEHDFSDGTTEIITNENIFTKLIPDQFIGSRAQAFLHIREGLTLNGGLSISEFLRSFPLEAVQKIAFSKPQISAEDIIDTLVPVYCAGWEQNDEHGRSFSIGSEADKVRHQHEQETFLKNILCQILIEKKKKEKFKYLSLFVKFCTGYDYLPDRDGNPDFKITVEFNFTERVKDSDPVAHTCANTLKLPGMLYTDGRKGFEKKLTDALLVYGKI